MADYRKFYFAEIFLWIFFLHEGRGMMPFLIIILKFFFLFELSRFQTYCLYCSCWFLTQGDLNHLSRLSFLLLCRLLGGTAGNWELFFLFSLPSLATDLFFRCRTLSGSPRPKNFKKVHFIKNMRQHDTRNGRYCACKGCFCRGSLWGVREGAGSASPCQSTAIATRHKSPNGLSNILCRVQAAVRAPSPREVPVNESASPQILRPVSP